MTRNRRIILGIVLIFAIYAVIVDPNQSADAVRGVFGMLAEGIQGIFRFFDALVQR